MGTGRSAWAAVSFARHEAAAPAPQILTDLIFYAERTWQLEMMFAGIITISIFLTLGYRFLHWYYRAPPSR